MRDLMDSLYHGYPVGYLIAWRNPDIKLKDGNSSGGKRILIDGQQRVTALNAAVLGESVVNEDYRKVNIQIAFHPIEEKFEVHNPAIAKDVAWLPNIADIVNGQMSELRSMIGAYVEANGVNEDLVWNNVDKLRNIKNTRLGLIELDAGLDIETVTEIFIRINSEGVVLSQADFVMSKIAANETYGGATLRKAIDYFCHLAVAPEFYPKLKENDTEFAQTEYFQKMSWLKNEVDDLYDPGYSDAIRVAFMTEFERAKLGDLVALLSGRNFEARTFEEDIAKKSFERFDTGVRKFINETNFKRFVMIIKSAGFVDTSMIGSMNALNFAYALYLRLRDMKYADSDIERYIRKWFVMSLLTGRHSGSFETQFEFDIKQLVSRDFGEYLQSIEEGSLSDAFWDVQLVSHLETSSSNSRYFKIFLAAQAYGNDKGFLSREITVRDLITHRGDIHHIFPRNYLKKHHYTRRHYNQIANFVYMQSEANIRIGDKAPNIYFSELKEQVSGGEQKYGGIDSVNKLHRNLRMNCIPREIFDMDVDNYFDFLEMRRKLMAEKIRDYYFKL